MTRYRYIPPNYNAICKEYAHHPLLWDEASESNEKVMLGGEYEEICRDNDNFVTLLKFDGPHNYKHISSLVESDKVKLCPYRVGDFVRFSPTCSEMDIQELLFYNEYDFNDRTRLHKIVHILNEYYIFLDFEDYKEKGFPFRWEDFEKVEQ